MIIITKYEKIGAEMIFYSIWSKHSEILQDQLLNRFKKIIKKTYLITIKIKWNLLMWGIEKNLDILHESYGTKNGWEEINDLYIFKVKLI